MATSATVGSDTTAPTRSTTATLARRALAAAGLGLVLTALARVVAVALDPALADVAQFAWPAVLGVTLVAAVGATAVHAVLERYTDRPARWFLLAAAVVFLAMLTPLTVGAADFAFTTNARVGLGALHLAAAVGIVAGVLGVDRVGR
jgi:hypothetical protein